MKIRVAKRSLHEHFSCCKLPGNPTAYINQHADGLQIIGAILACERNKSMFIVNHKLIQAFLAATDKWELADSSAAALVGATSSMIQDWRSENSTAASEEVLARMMMVASIRTALDIIWSESLAKRWISLPNRGEPYNGLSPVAYAIEHGWPGLYWILCQVQALAVGNF
jgi:hypothetical protein